MKQVEELTIKLADNCITDEEHEKLLELLNDKDALNDHILLLEIESELIGMCENIDCEDAVMDEIHADISDRIEKNVMGTIHDLPARVWAREESFDEEDTPEPVPLQRTSRRSRFPWWAVSIAFHAACLVLATVWTVMMPPAEHEPPIAQMDIKPLQGTGYAPTWKFGIRTNDAMVAPDPGVLERPDLIKDDILSFDLPETKEQKHKAMYLGEIVTVEYIKGEDIFPEIIYMNGLKSSFTYKLRHTKKYAIGRFGGSRETEAAVLRSLEWFKRHHAAE
jgi:hypothetical protein